MQIHPYIHEYEFPYHDYLLNNLDFFTNHFLKGIDEARKNSKNNVFFYNNSIWRFLNKKLVEIVQKNYYVDDYFIDSKMGIYMQDDKNGVYTPHNHVGNYSIIGVMYINPPKKEEGGGLILYPDTLNNPFIIQPEKDKLYLFPSWMMHSPLPQTTLTPRMSLNWGYKSGIRPIHKITGDIW